MLIARFGGGELAKIAELEERYHITFPEEYRAFLVKYNGGFTPKTKFKKGRMASDLKGFYGIGKVKLSFDSLDMEKWLCLSMWPTACDSFGNLILTGLDQERRGKIYFWDHERGGALTLLGADLSQFVSLCKSERISENARRSIQEREAALIQRGRGGVITDALRKMWQDELDKYGDMIQEELILA
ncbi:MAG: SMI1/KNR4 family protein [Lawsonibacter sp.]|nr:SMI1/KNR4 family protein [Lawsonibacter sp.]